MGLAYGKQALAGIEQLLLRHLGRLVGRADIAHHLEAAPVTGTPQLLKRHGTRTSAIDQHTPPEHITHAERSKQQPHAQRHQNSQ
jgi:hypothetical protein